jgi:hypothetical protein
MMGCFNAMVTIKQKKEMIKKHYLILLLFLPVISNAQFTDALNELKTEENPEYAKYERLVYDVTQYIFSNPVNVKSKEFLSATKIVGFWMNEATDLSIPTFGDFFTSLTNKNQQQFLYTVAMINYGLDQKINHGRILKCVKIEGKKYSEQEDVREVQMGGAKILLEYIGDRKNNVPINRKTKKYLKAYNQGELETKLFD